MSFTYVIFQYFYRILNFDLTQGMAFYEDFDSETDSDISKVDEYVPKVDPNILKDDLYSPKHNLDISNNDADKQKDKNKEIKVEYAGIACARIWINSKSNVISKVVES